MNLTFFICDHKLLWCLYLHKKEIKKKLNGFAQQTSNFYQMCDGILLTWSVKLDGNLEEFISEGSIMHIDNRGKCLKYAFSRDHCIVINFARLTVKTTLFVWKKIKILLSTYYFSFLIYDVCRSL